MSAERRVVEATSRTTPRKDRRRSEAGDTLVEVLLAVIVLGMASVALIIAFGTSLSASADHRQLSASGVVLDSVSQQVISEMQAQPVLFTCPTAGTPAGPEPLSYYVANVPMTTPSNYSASFASSNPIEFWNTSTSTFGTTCEAGEPQQVTITIIDNTDHLSFSNSFVVDSPLDTVTTGSSGSTNYGAAAQLVFTTEPVGGSTGEELATQPVIDVEDSSGNIVTDDLSPVILTLTGASATSNPSATLSGCAGTETAGVVTFSGCTINDPGTSYTITATDGDFSGSYPSTAFSVSASTDYLVFASPQPAAGASGALMAAQPVVEAYANGTLDTSWTGTITLTSSGGSLTNCSSMTAVLGVATFTSCHFAGAYFYNPISGVYLATPYTLTASASNSVPTSPVTSQTFSVTGPGSASQLVFTTQPTGAAGTSAATVFSTQPVVTVEDSFGNIVNTSSAPITLTISSGGLSCSSNPLAASGGAASFTNCEGNNYGTGLTLTASSTGLASTTSASFNITGLPSKLIFTTQPAAGVSGTAFTTQPVITVEDASGLTVTASTTAITLTASGGTLSLCTDLTPYEGVISVATCNFAGIVGSPYTVTATQVTALATLTATSATFSPTTAGTATQLAFTTEPVAGAAGSPFTTQPVVAIEDSAGNITTSTATISLSSSGGVLTSCSNLSGVEGVVDVSGCTFGGLISPATYTLTATSGSLSLATSTSFTPTGPGPASPTASMISATPTSVSANGSTTSTVTVSLYDAYGNVNPNDSVTLTQGSGSSVITTNPGTASSSGVVTYTVVDSTPQTVTFGAIDTTDGVTLTPTASVIFFGPATKIVLSGCSSGVASTGTCVATATLEDLNGATVTNYNGAIAFNQTNTGGGSVTGLTGTTTFTNGVANVTLTGNKAGTVVLDAVGDSFTSNSLTFSVVPGPATKIVLSGCSSNIASTTTCVATATLEDVNGNTVTSYQGGVTFSQTNTGGSVTGLTSTTNFTNGVANVTLTGDIVGSIVIDASGDGFTSNNVTFSVTPGPPNKVVLTGCSADIASNTTCVATATLEDINGNTITTYNGAIAFNQTNTGGGSVTGLTGTTTFTNGVANVTLTGNKVGVVTIDAVGDAFTSNTQTFNVNFGTPNKVALTGCGASLPSATGCVATATLEDINGNTITTYNGGVVFNQTNTGGGSVTGLNGTTNFTNGVANVTLSGDVVGSVVIDAVGDGFTSNNVTFSVTPGIANKLVITSTAFTATASTTTRDAFTTTLEDLNGNATSSSSAITVNLAVTPTSGTSFYAASAGGSAVTSVTLPANTSTVTSYLVDYTSGSDTITVSATGLTSGTQVETINPGPASQIILTGCTTSIVSTGTCTATATLEDVNANTVTSYNGAVAFNQTNTGAGSVTGLTGTTNFTNGVANVTLTGNKTGSVVIDAVGDGFTSNSQTFSVTSGPATQLVITSAPFTTTASTSTRNVFTVTLEDANGNATTRTTALTVNLADSPTSGSSFYVAASGGSAVTSVTLPANTSTVNAYLVDSTSGSDTITVSATGGSPSSGSQVETINPGPATQVVLSGCSNNITSSSTCVATATLEDTNGNTVNTYNGAVTFNQTNTGAGTVTGLTGTTAFTNGVANVTLTATKAGLVTIDAVGDGFTSNSQSFTVTFGTATQVVLSGCSTNITSSSTCMATATLEDANGNTVTSYAGTVAFNQTNTGGTVSGLTGTTHFTSGVANVTLTGVKAGLVTIDAVGDGFTSGTTSFTVTFGTATKVVLSGCASNIASGSGCVATATLEDANSNTITTYGGAVAFNQTNTGGTVSGLTSTTSFTNGVANVTLTGVKSGSVVIDAVGDGFTSGTVTFSVTGGTPTQLVITSTAFTATASTTTRNVFTTTLEDAAGNATTSTSAITVNLAVSPTSGTSFYAASTGGSAVTSVTLPANASTVNAYLVDSTSGSDTITVSATGLTSGTQVETINPSSGTKLVITSTAFTATASTTTRNAFTVTLEDPNGNATTSASAITVNLAVSPTSGTSFYAASTGGSAVTSVTLPANASTVNAYLVDSTSGSDTITVSATGLTSGTQVETINPGPGTKLIITSSSYTNNGSGTRDAVTVTLEDTNGNATTNTSAISLTLSASPATGTLFYASATGGSAITTTSLPANTSALTFYYADTSSTNNTLTVSAGGTPTSATQSET